MGRSASDPPHPAAPTQGDSLTFEIPARPEDVSVARREVHRFLVDHDVPDGVAADVQLVASELVTNAVQHAGTSPIGVEVRVRPLHEVTLSVANIGSTAGIPPVPTWSIPPGLVPSGRGLGIVRQLTDDVDVLGDEHRAVVVCRRRWSGEEDPR